MESQSSRGAGIGRAAAFAFGTASLLVQKATQDGHLAAFARQGGQELYDGLLKPFPDVTSVREPGTIFNPTQGEVAADRRGGVFGHHASGIVGGRHGVYGPEHERPAGRTPSEIAADRGNVHGPEQGHGQEHGHER